MAIQNWKKYKQKKHTLKKVTLYYVNKKYVNYKIMQIVQNFSFLYSNKVSSLRVIILK